MSESNPYPAHDPSAEAGKRGALMSQNNCTSLGLFDSTWNKDQWQHLVGQLVQDGIATWLEVAALLLGHLNPPQVGTSLASSQGFKKLYRKGKTMPIVMGWIYSQDGRCADCGSRLELQADHITGREQFKDPLDADFIKNMTLRCRRCNVVRRPSHRHGGETFLTAEAALMWVLFVVRPRTPKRLYASLSNLRNDDG